jgi:nitronate monooxygenase
MLETRFTRLVGCEAPVQLAPMGGIVTPELAAAVTGAGGHAMAGITGQPAAVVEQFVGSLREATEGRFGVNVLVPFLDREVFELAAGLVPLVELYHGDPDAALIEAAHVKGAMVSWQVTSGDEAEAAERAGCDLIVAHGVEAGGRMPGGIGLLTLLQHVLDKVRTIPVLAAGGIATPRGLAAVLAAGADGARLGTRFLASQESGAHPDYVRAVVDASSEDTTLARRFNVMWPDESNPPHRVLRSAIEAAEAISDETVGEMRVGREVYPLPRFAVPPPNLNFSGSIEAMALYAGESAGLIDEVRPAADIVRELCEGAADLLSRRQPALT